MSKNDQNDCDLYRKWKNKFCWNIFYVWGTFNVDYRVDVNNCHRVESASEGIKEYRISKKMYYKNDDKE